MRNHILPLETKASITPINNPKLIWINPIIAPIKKAVIAPVKKAETAPVKKAETTPDKKPEAKPADPIEAVTIKKIGTLSLGVSFALVSVFIGLLIGLFFTIMSFFSSDPFMEGVVGDILVGIWAALSLPFLFGILFFIIGIMLALFYNISAKLGNGIKLYS